MSAATDAVRALATARPDAITDCKMVNSTTKKPDCIIGHWLVGLGIGGDVLALVNGMTVDRLVQGDLGDTYLSVRRPIEIIRKNLPELEPGDIDWLETVQTTQDLTGKTWADAIAAADLRAEERRRIDAEAAARAEERRRAEL